MGESATLDPTLVELITALECDPYLRRLSGSGRRRFATRLAEEVLPVIARLRERGEILTVLPNPLYRLATWFLAEEGADSTTTATAPSYAEVAQALGEVRAAHLRLHCEITTLRRTVAEMQRFLDASTRAHVVLSEPLEQPDGGAP